METVCCPLQYMNSIITWIQLKSIIRYLLINIVPIQQHYRHLTHYPKLWSVQVLNLTSTTLPYKWISRYRTVSSFSLYWGLCLLWHVFKSKFASVHRGSYYKFIHYMNSTKADYHVRNIYINSMNIQIHVFIECTCL